MKSVLHALQALQEVDKDLHRVHEELKRLPLERATRAAEIDKAATRIADVRNEAKRHRVRIKEIEDATATQRARVRKLESEAAASRQDVALLVAYQHEIRTIKRDMSTVEDEALGLIEKAESLERDAALLQDRLDAERKIFDEFAANVERELAQAEERKAKLGEKRKQRMSQDLTPEALGTYTRLLAAREGQPLARLEGRLCQACYMEIPTNMVIRVTRGLELVQCPSCDRILYQG